MRFDGIDASCPFEMVKRSAAARPVHGNDAITICRLSPSTLELEPATSLRQVRGCLLKEESVKRTLGAKHYQIYRNDHANQEKDGERDEK